MEKTAKCACPTCRCPVDQPQAVKRNGKVYCSATCANECTQTTCLCVHDSCEGHAHSGGGKQ